MIRPLGLAGVRTACVAQPDWAPARSRFSSERIGWEDSWERPEALLRNLLAFAERQPRPAPLFVQQDRDLLFCSRNRDALDGAFRLVLADAETIEGCVDKASFGALAEGLGLPVPRSVALRPREGSAPPDLPLEFPLVVKPVTRREALWRPHGAGRKALELGSQRELGAAWPGLVRIGMDLVAQELVPGAEDRIESYHAYVDEGGETAAEFTGRKLRTLPIRFGETTALEITDAGDVRELGRECTRALGLRGVAKLDFKRAPSGALRLLEVNPRFTLWHHPGALAGVNIPAIVYADLVGLPRPSAARARPGVTWSMPWKDYRAARAEGMPPLRWAHWQARCDAWHVIAADDPMPFLATILWPRIKRPLRPRS
ncbi:MAG TPA: ATP-grasp domain-containing protein [Thermoleophilaceae bacterium]